MAFLALVINGNVLVTKDNAFFDSVLNGAKQVNSPN
jgi:hypothetical protein